MRELKVGLTAGQVDRLRSYIGENPGRSFRQAVRDAINKGLAVLMPAASTPAGGSAIIAGRIGPEVLRKAA